jgi:IK cytokine
MRATKLLSKVYTIRADPPSELTYICTLIRKGLDFTLLEQNKARSSENQSADFDEALEDAYKSASSSTQPPPAKTSTSSAKKRTREDLIRELKESREKGAGAPKAEGAVASKFKPIGAPKANEEVKKKKKRKIVATESSKVTSDSATMAPPPLPQSSKLSLQRKPKPLVEEEPPDDSFDIFADAGEYEGLDMDSDEEPTAPKKEGEELEATLSKTNWFGEQSATEDDTPFKPPPPMPTKQQSRSPSPQPTRLVPLSSSALPSISEFLAMDADVEKAEKRKARKEKAKLKAEGKKTKGDESD